MTSLPLLLAFIILGPHSSHSHKMHIKSNTPFQYLHIINLHNYFPFFLWELSTTILVLFSHKTLHLTTQELDVYTWNPGTTNNLTVTGCVNSVSSIAASSMNCESKLVPWSISNMGTGGWTDLARSLTAHADLAALKNVRRMCSGQTRGAHPIDPTTSLIRLSQNRLSLSL